MTITMMTNNTGSSDNSDLAVRQYPPPLQPQLVMVQQQQQRQHSVSPQKQRQRQQQQQLYESITSPQKRRQESIVSPHKRRQESVSPQKQSKCFLPPHSVTNNVITSDNTIISDTPSDTLHNSSNNSINSDSTAAVISTISHNNNNKKWSTVQQIISLIVATGMLCNAISVLVTFQPLYPNPHPHQTTTGGGGGNDSSNDSSNMNTQTDTLRANITISSFHDKLHSQLPDWFIEYSEWHTKIVQNLTIDNYSQYQYVLLTCMNHTKCYGTSDRLKMIPVMVKLAALSQRIFFIYWSKPYPIEEFLVPNTVYMNWTVPSHLYQSLMLRDANNNDNSNYPVWKLGRHFTDGMNDESSKVQNIIRIQHCTYAADWYNKNRMNNTIIHSRTVSTNETSDMVTADTLSTTEVELSMWEIYNEFWDAMFVPSIGLYTELYSTLQRLRLVKSTYNSEDDNQTITNSIVPVGIIQLQEQVKPYISVHVRANYAHDNSNNTHQSVINPINCGYQLQQQLIEQQSQQIERREQSTLDEIPIYIASDTSSVIDRAMQYGQDEYQIRVVSNTNISNDTSTNNPYHIDQTIPTATTVPRDYYPTFIDLYILSLGSCYTWGVGGYGSWAAAIGTTAICPSTITHTKQQC